MIMLLMLHLCFSFYRVEELAAARKAKLQDSLTLQQFFADVQEDEAWIK